MKHKAQFPKLTSPAILSPMSGVTDVAFRALARSLGAGLTYTEFVSGTAILRANINSLRMIQTDPIEKPVAVQLFGSSVTDVVLAAQRLENTFDIIDVNCGCPAWKVIKIGAGSELLRKPEGIAQFINQLASAVSKPVTLKIRIGIDDTSINAVTVAKLAQDAGAAAIAIHGRTQAQGYSGAANWDVIKSVKEAVDIPVIGNGDVFTPEQFKEKLEYSGVDAIMIARGAIGNPAIFSQINDYLAEGSYQQTDRISLFFDYLERAEKYHIPFASIQTHAMSFTKGTIGGANLRQELSRAKTTSDILALLKNHSTQESSK